MSIEALIRAAEPTAPRPLGGLVGRLEAAGLYRAARRDASPANPLALAEVAIGSLVFDSRRMRAGGLFVAIPGDRADGHAYLGDVASAGAVAAIVERADDRLPLVQVVVSDARRALAVAAAWWYADPSARLGVVGITGTDGKTTTSYLAVAALERAAVPTGLIGTVETKIGPEREAHAAHVTTPEAPELQGALRAMVNAGDRAAVIETTSHGLALRRVDEIAYDAAILTNLSHEHLELHGSFEAYRAAKLSLFERLGPGGPAKSWPRAGIVNADDAAAPFFEDAVRATGVRLLTYGTAGRADVRATRIEEGSDGLRFEVSAPGWSGSVALRLRGGFNVHNALAVIALGRALELDPEAIRDGIESVGRVPGRMEWIDAGQPFDVVVDFAHSPAALGAALDALAPVAAARDGSLLVVFGSAGERDRAKRPLMGRVAGDRCRLVVLTDEDPRGEDPTAILEEIAAGAVEAGKRRDDDLLLIPDRRAAVRAAFAAARPGDVVLLAGKGHEQAIAYAAGDLPWDEAAEARQALAALGFGQR